MVRERRSVMVAALLVLACVAVVGPASAQTSNPTLVTWDHADYASAQRYEGGYFALTVRPDNTCDLVGAPATAPTAVDSWARPTTTTGVGMSATLSARPIGCYVLRVRALDTSGLYSDWSEPSDPFVRRPATPARPILR